MKHLLTRRFVIGDRGTEFPVPPRFFECKATGSSD
jgi:hypothetical protein